MTAFAQGIVVSSNCQTNGLAAVMRRIFSKAVVTAVPVLGAMDQAPQSPALLKALAASQVWITFTPKDITDKVLAALNGHQLQVIQVPAIGFSAFHPDLCYVRNERTNTLTTQHYNSAIAAWAYMRGVDRVAAQRLFNLRSYRELGYFDQWQSSRDFLERSFKYCKLQDCFDEFFLHVQRRGLFMHSTNHPRIEVLERLGKLLALKLAPEHDTKARELDVEDELANVKWPLYPEVADHLALPGGDYLWRFSASETYEGVEDYLDYAYRSYETQGLEPGQMTILNRSLEQLDSVLAAQLRGV
jgi:hypothetical protein